MTDHAHELRRYARKIAHPAGDVPAVMRAAADEIERLQSVIAGLRADFETAHARMMTSAEREREACAAICDEEADKMEQSAQRAIEDGELRAGHIKLYGSDPLPFVAPCSATDCMPELVRFAAIVAAAEREACREVLEECIRTQAHLACNAREALSEASARIYKRGDA